jgi:hypothetical protein
MPMIWKLIIRRMMLLRKALGRARSNRVPRRKQVRGAASEPHCVAPTCGSGR